MFCLLMLEHLRSFVMNVVRLAQVGFVITGVGGQLKGSFYRNNVACQTYAGIRIGKSKIVNSISNIPLNTNRDTIFKGRNDEGE